MALASTKIASLGKIVRGTPIWVWILLGYVIFIGISATKKRDISIPQLFITPVVLMGLKYKGFLAASTLFLLYYGLSLAGGIVLGFIAGAYDVIHEYKKNYSIVLAGSYQTIILLLAFFCSKYVFGFLHATNPLLASQYGWVEGIISGLLPGIFLGKTLNYLLRFNKALNK